MSYTPGPWTAVLGDVTDVDGDAVADALPPDRDYDTAIANAHLIAAAPDLLAALEMMCCHIGDPQCENSAVARAAIAKATASD